MRVALVLLLSLALGQAAPQPAPSAPFPQTEIRVDTTRAALYLPDPARGYYRGTRFDWSGVVSSLRWNGHEYFGEWFEKHDPVLHDGITGPVDEFLTGTSSLGYEEAAAGAPFVRIGVGAVKKPAGETAYQRFATYEIVDHGKWTVTPSGDHVTFVHELGDTNGYAYRYEKIVRVSAARLMLEYKLRNTGRKRIDTTVCNHNFFTLDRRGTGPDSSVTFAFDAKARRPVELAAFDGRRLRFTKVFGPKETMFTEIDGFGATASDYDFRIENRDSKAGVRITSDRPLDRLSFWSHPKTICPEPFIDVSVDPGAERTWFIHYELYDVE
jgi:hypothetical protein